MVADPDAEDNAWLGPGTAGVATHRDLERLLQRVVWLMPGAFFVIAGRSRLQWADPALQGELDWTGPAAWPDLASPWPGSGVPTDRTAPASGRGGHILKVEAFNGFSDWVRFGQHGTVAANDPDEQEKDVRFTSLLANLVIFHNTLDIADAVRRLQAEGWVIGPLDLAQVSPYLTEHIKRFGEYSTHELGITPDAYDAHLDVDFSALGDDRVAAA